MGTGFPTNTILQNFETGDKPTQDQFAQFINGVGTIDDNSPLNNFSATTDPTANDDAGDGYSVGSRWNNTSTNKEFICMNPITAAAVWEEISTGTVGTGTVTSVALSAPSEFNVSGSPVTSAGTLTLTKANQSANFVNAGPASGASAQPTYRALVSADIVNIVGSSYSNLSITQNSGTPTTQLDMSADYVVAISTTGTALFKSAFSATINAATTGANGLDGGSLANSTWYYAYAIAKADGTWAGLLSASSSSPSMPTDYIYKRRLGAVRTNGSAQFMRTLQKNERVQYVVASGTTTTAMPLVASGGTASTWTAASVSAIVPPTAQSIHLTCFTTSGTQDIAPNGNYSNGQSTTNPAYIYNNTGLTNQSTSLVLESTNIYYRHGSSAYVWCQGWVDNL